LPSGSLPSGAPDPAALAAGLQYSSLQGTIVVTDPFLSRELDQVLTNPVSHDRPTLLHFEIAPDPMPWGSDVIFGRQPGPARALIFAISGLVLVATSLALARWGKHRHARVVASVLLAPAAIAGLLTLVVAMSTSTITVSARAVTTQVAPAANATRLVTVNAPAAVVNTQPGRPDPWSQLFALETQLSRQHDQLAGVEAKITSLTALLEGSVIRAPRIVALQDSLADLVNQHADLAGAYQQSVQDEYAFFVATVESAAQTRAVTAGAATSTPAAQQVVAYNLEVVKTQVAQEAAVAAAEAAQAAATAAFTPPKGPIAFHAPVGGVVSQGFGPTDFSLEPPITYNGVFYPHFHTGFDIAAPRDTPIGAAADGVVVLATSSLNSNGQYVGYGNYVLINHGNGFYTLYGHMDQLLVSTGQVVHRGQVIGLLGSTGWSTGPHVHFEIRVNGKPVDPAPYIAANLR
jgi:murein DD-endopeptidase MepM/ murein hydrolase activator NlpD